MWMRHLPFLPGVQRLRLRSRPAARVADAMSSAWISFAKTGIPSAASLPAWEAYTRSGGATMILDTESALVFGHDRNLIQILAPGYQW